MWEAVKPRARANVRFAPDRQLQALMDGAPKATFSRRAAELGFAPSRDIDEIVREYEDATVAI